jgi:hypothetical protein
MPGTATVTGKVGGGVTLTSGVFQNVSFFSLDTTNEVLTIKYNNGDGAKEIAIDVSAQTTWTLTVSGNTYTLTVT